MMHIKTVNITNPKNVLVQIPGFISKKWALSTADHLEVNISEDEQAIIIRPRRFVDDNVRTGSDANQESQRMVRSAT